MEQQVVDSQVVTNQKNNKWYSRFRLKGKGPVATVALVLVVLVLLSGAAVLAFNLLQNDSAVFNSSINAKNPTRQHVLQVDGSGELIAHLDDRTQNPEDQVRYRLTMLNAEGELLQRVVASTVGSHVQINQGVEPGLYTFIVSTDDALSASGAYYTLEILYPNDTAEFTDETSPDVEITEPTLGETVTGVFTLKGTASDETELSQIAVRVGQSDWVVTNGLESWSVDIDSSRFDNGNNILTVRATDASGNSTVKETLLEFQNEADNAPPETNPSPNPTSPSDPPETTQPTNPSDPNTSPDEPTSSGDFFEDFTDNTGLDELRVGVYHRNIGQQELGQKAEIWGDNNAGHGGSWTGDHDKNCGSPDTQRKLSSTKTGGGPEVGWVPIVDFNLDQIVYTCKNHLMTSMGDVDGYSILWFAPDQTFKRSETRTVSWAVNLTDLMARQWWEVSIVPKDGTFLATVDWVAGTAGVDQYDSEAVVVGSGPFGNTVNMTANRNNHYSGWQSICGIDPEGCNSKRLRRPFSITDNGNGTLTVDYAGVHTQTFKGRFPDEFEVYFKDHNYNPDKDGTPAGHTWHWDNIKIN